MSIKSNYFLLIVKPKYSAKLSKYSAKLSNTLPNPQIPCQIPKYPSNFGVLRSEYLVELVSSTTLLTSSD